MALSPGDRRSLIILGVVVVVAAVVFIVVNLGGGGGQTAASPSLQPFTPPVTVSPSSSAQPGSPQPTFVLGFRDPFSPIPVTPIPSPGSSSSPSPSPTSSTHAPNIGPSHAIRGQNVTLLGVSKQGGTEVVDLLVGATEYPSLSANDTFAQFYKLLQVQGSCVQVQYKATRTSTPSDFQLCVRP